MSLSLWLRNSRHVEPVISSRSKQMWCNLYFRSLYNKIEYAEQSKWKAQATTKHTDFQVKKSKFGKRPWARTAWRRHTQLQQLLPRLLHVYFRLCFNVVFFFYCLFFFNWCLFFMKLPLVVCLPGVCESRSGERYLVFYTCKSIQWKWQ